MAGTKNGAAKRLETLREQSRQARAAVHGQYPEEWNKLPLIRADAKALGQPLYFTGKRCSKGHIAPMQTSKGVCNECHRAYATSEQGHATQRAIYARRMKSDPAYAQTNRDNAKRHYHRVMKHDDERMARHYEKSAVYQKEHRSQANRNRRAFNARNPGYGRVHVVARRARMKHSDLSPAEQRQVNAIYALRVELQSQKGVELNVDHLRPLRRGGAHHPANLLIITKAANLFWGAKIKRCPWPRPADWNEPAWEVPA